MQISHYKTIDKSDWQGRTDSETDRDNFRIHQVVELLDIAKPESEKHLAREDCTKKYAIVGYAADEGVRRNKGRTGSAQGPMVLRRVLGNSPVHLGASECLFDIGNIVCPSHDLETTQTVLSEITHALMKYNVFPICIGGGHDLAYGQGKGLYAYAKEKGERLGIINFDAHFDLKEKVDDKGNSCSSFLQLADHCKEIGQEYHCLTIGVQQATNTRVLYAKAKELGVKYISRDQLHHHKILEVANILDEFLLSVDKVYVTVCLDVFDGAFAPGVSVVSTYGITPENFFPLFKHIKLSGKMNSFSVAELNPSHDHDNLTAKLTARIIHEVLS
ncbi:MAG: formimidoylglutamase [bacterium]|nr:formimidoylglutamase [bacterium]MBU1918446.1 formimidoylglutamase [bacterium]